MDNKCSQKVIPIEDVANIIHSGQVIGIGGMTLYRRPVSLVREVIRSRQYGLRLLAVTCGFESDLLVGSGQLYEVATTYFGLEFLGLAPCYTQFATKNLVSTRIETETSIILGLKAAATGVPFMPGRFGMHTDLLSARADVKKIKCPYTDREFIAWPKLNVDVALIHVNACDVYGNAQISGEIGIDELLVAAAKKVIISTERIVAHEEIRKTGAVIVGKAVDFIVEAPFGAHPTSLYPQYRVDVPYLADYVTMCRNEEFFKFLKGRFLLPWDQYRTFIDEQQLSF